MGKKKISIVALLSIALIGTYWLSNPGVPSEAFQRPPQQQHLKAVESGAPAIPKDVVKPNKEDADQGQTTNNPPAVVDKKKWVKEWAHYLDRRARIAEKFEKIETHELAYDYESARTKQMYRAQLLQKLGRLAQEGSSR